MLFLFLSFVSISNIMNIQRTLESWLLTSVDSIAIFRVFSFLFSFFPRFSCLMCRSSKIPQEPMFNVQLLPFFFSLHESNPIAFVSIFHCLCQFFTFHNVCMIRKICNRFQFLCFIIIYYCCWKRFRIPSDPISSDMCVVCLLHCCILLLFRWLCSKSNMSLCVAPNEMKDEMKKWREPSNI